MSNAWAFSESNDFLKFLTQQAVAMAKTMTAMQNKTNVKGNLPLPMQPPERSLIHFQIKRTDWFIVTITRRLILLSSFEKKK